MEAIGLGSACKQFSAHRFSSAKHPDLSSCTGPPSRNSIAFSSSKERCIFPQSMKHFSSALNIKSENPGLNLRKPLGKTCSAGIRTYEGSAFDIPYQHAAEDKVGVLLLNLGGPDTLQDVQPFLYNLFADPDIIRLPRLFRLLQRPLAQLISTLRASKSKEGYAAIGGGSPLRKITIEQAQALRDALKAKNVRANVYVGMRYWYPFTEEAIQQIKRDGVTRLVVLPLYPQFSISTSGSSIRLLRDIFWKDSNLARLPVSIIESWYKRQGYIKSMADLIGAELVKFSKPEEVILLPRENVLVSVKHGLS